jgi:hypothetical protein
MIRIRTLALAGAGPAIAGLVTLASLASAQQPPPGPPRQPPPEAFAACESKSDGDTCTVSFHGHEIHGVCTTESEGKRLFCRPTEPPPPPPSGS